MAIRPRIGVGVQPYMARSALHAAFEADGRVESILLPEVPDVRLQTWTTDVDVLVVSSLLVRPDVLVVVASPDGSLELVAGSAVKQQTFGGVSHLVDTVLEAVDSRRRHPSARVADAG
jgi:hypothetical protein